MAEISNHKLPAETGAKLAALCSGNFTAWNSPVASQVEEIYEQIRTSLQAEAESSGTQSMSKVRRTWLLFDEFFSALMCDGFQTGVMCNNGRRLHEFLEACSELKLREYADVLTSAKTILDGIPIKDESNDAFEISEAIESDTDLTEQVETLETACDSAEPEGGSIGVLAKYAIANPSEFFES